MLAQALQHVEGRRWTRVVATHERILAILLAIEIAVFCVIGRGFVSLSSEESRSPRSAADPRPRCPRSARCGRPHGSGCVT